MRNAFLKLYMKAQSLRQILKKENGQDLVEYALVVALIALGATVGMTNLATQINTAFSNLGTMLTSQQNI